MTWLDARWAAFDVESSGVDTDNDRIVSAHIALIGGGLPPEHHSWLINPGIPIPAGATAVHGITDEIVREDGLPADIAVRDIGDEIWGNMQAGVPIVGWNVVYDLSILNAESIRHELPPFNGIATPVIDGLVLDKHYDTYRKGSRRLVDVAKHYGVPIADGDAHGAKADAMAAARIVWKIARKYPEILDMSLAELHDVQITWALAQQESFEMFKRRTDPAFTVQRGWPIYDRGNTP